ncbi:MAG: hypothetical protein CL916_07825 [Deltaproteobacteria bacterium]|nr:hypothetical protein [Deltaproteobacteria bacterium]
MHLLSRRHFLMGVGATALLSAAIAIPQLGSYPKTKLEVHTLSDREVHIYRIVGDWLLPSGGGLPGSGGDDITIMRIDALLTNLPPDQRQLLKALPLVFEHGTALNRFAQSRMSSLSSQEKESYLRSWTESTHLISAQLVAALRTIYALSYFERIDVQEAMHVPPSCIPS